MAKKYRVETLPADLEARANKLINSVKYLSKVEVYHLLFLAIFPDLVCKLYFILDMSEILDNINT